MSSLNHRFQTYPEHAKALAAATPKTVNVAFHPDNELPLACYIFDDALKRVVEPPPNQVITIRDLRPEVEWLSPAFPPTFPPTCPYDEYMFSPRVIPRRVTANANGFSPMATMSGMAKPSPTDSACFVPLGHVEVSPPCPWRKRPPICGERVDR